LLSMVAPLCNHPFGFSAPSDGPAPSTNSHLVSTRSQSNSVNSESSAASVSPHVFQKCCLLHKLSVVASNWRIEHKWQVLMSVHVGLVSFSTFLQAMGIFHMHLTVFCAPRIRLRLQRRSVHFKCFRKARYKRTGMQIQPFCFSTRSIKRSPIGRVNTTQQCPVRLVAINELSRINRKQQLCFHNYSPVHSRV
jgi:hypothetical protein